MRGKVNSVSLDSRNTRITPAYAGKSCRYSIIFTIDKDHPRLCGEKIVSNGRSIDAPGSPPPMRGKGLFGVAFNSVHRITPAYAGKSSFASCSFASFRDHPRLCGEKFLIPRIAGSQLGSPPPMRGKDYLSDFGIVRLRITPAYAGKSPTEFPDQG